MSREITIIIKTTHKETPDKLPLMIILLTEGLVIQMNPVIKIN